MTSFAALCRSLFAGAQSEDLPERVRTAIREQQDRSEVLSGWFQLAVVVTFGSLYLAAPKTFSDDSAFAPVPWALSIYLALTVIRLVWARHGRLPAWSLAFSVIFDMGLLMVLIWSFHLQYQQPASFYLKAPTLLYVFIFIALRALRFEARFVLLAGLVAALGWGLLIVYVVLDDPVDMMITRDYVEYMTSNSILLGAEFDKIISILVVTVIIAVALQRAKGLLVRAVAQLREYFAGTRRAFDLPLDPPGGTFQKAVCDAMLDIPFGETRTYGDLARALHVAPQPVGQACGGNPIPILIPCHRVVAADGKLGGFSGGRGVETKLALLRHEGAILV